MRACALFVVLAVMAAVCGCQTPGADSAADHDGNQKIGANAD
jgi:hypothetical protein